MSLPQPETPLNDACSVIFDHTLYTYSADAFQSLRLEPGAEWEVLPQGEKVTGGACVGSTTGNPATSAFFVVGGKGGNPKYLGLQKFTFSTGQWENVPVDTLDISGRTGHSAVYLNSTDSILVYGGGSEGQASSQTFTVGAAAPHTIRSHESWAPPAVKPILLPWSTHEAVMLGGNPDNKQVYLFNNEEGKWLDSRATLATPLKDASAVQAVLLGGADGSQNLLTFDMTESPNIVRRTVLYTGPGQPVAAAAPVTKRSARRRTRSAARQQRRRFEPLTLNNWPAYNSSLAPTTTRTNFALAKDIDGMVVIAGGNSEDPVAMFDTTTNTWQNATEMLGQIRLLSLDDEESSTTLSSTTATSTTATLSTSTSSTLATITSDAAAAATATPTETDAPVAGGSGSNVNMILGAVLGSVFGLALILGLIYFCLRRRTRQQAHTEAGHIRRSNGASSSDKDGIGYAKDRLAFGQGPAGVFRGHQSQGSKSSFSSMAILMGRASESKPRLPGIGRKGSKSSNGSKRDSGDSVFRAFKSTISKPILPEVPSPQPMRDEKGVSFTTETAEPRPRNLTTTDKRESTRRSSGWNRYWSGGSALNMLGFGSSNSNIKNNSQRTTLHSERSSKYSDQQNRMTQDSVTVPRLQIHEPRLSFSRVNSHSPTIATYNNTKFNEGMSAQIETGRPISAVSDLSMSAYSSGIPESVHEVWDPTASNNRPWGMERQNSSNTGIYATALAPASAAKPPAEPAPLRKQPSAVRDDMSWLNLG
ncbi:uncharacterized protein QC761_112410 [Podospora bellae-mahoneyi]|uniref:Pre-mRNA splicing factor CLF1 n=1 Tax=Podospora bellae-mahoneyi TaxID=2093777 RepID=A0ABR0FZ01_9PEZI|nr:hypothetical protein QC761_112410 [Podospora bellae-mahoneyi]